MSEAPLSSVPVIKVITQRGHSDCGVACIGMYLGIPYEDSLAAAVSSTKDKHLHKRGMWTSMIVRTAAELNVKLKRRKKWDYEEASGILVLCNVKSGEWHVVVLKHNLLFDPADGCCWTPAGFFANSRYEARELLTQD